MLGKKYYYTQYHYRKKVLYSAILRHVPENDIHGQFYKVIKKSTVL